MAERPLTGGYPTRRQAGRLEARRRRQPGVPYRRGVSQGAGPGRARRGAVPARLLEGREADRAHRPVTDGESLSLSRWERRPVARIGAVTGMGGRGMVRLGFLGRSGAGACPNLPQRRFAAGSAANESAEYQRFSSGAPARSGSLWQIWTTRAAASPRKGGRRSDGDRGGPPTGRTGTAGRRGRALTGLTRVPLRRGRPAVRTWTRTGGRRP